MYDALPVQKLETRGCWPRKSSGARPEGHPASCPDPCQFLDFNTAMSNFYYMQVICLI
jgi:hypothetical protein